MRLDQLKFTEDPYLERDRALTRLFFKKFKTMIFRRFAVLDAKRRIYSSLAAIPVQVAYHMESCQDLYERMWDVDDDLAEYTVAMIDGFEDTIDDDDSVIMPHTVPKSLAPQVDQVNEMIRDLYKMIDAIKELRVKAGIKKQSNHR